MEIVESAFSVVVQWLKLLLEITGALLVAVGAVTSLGHLFRALSTKGTVRFTPVRLHFARHLSFALEFQLAADILGTTIAPTWEQIGKLGAIAVIRTALNYFLGREMQEERETIDGEGAVREELAESHEVRPPARAL